MNSKTAEWYPAVASFAESLDDYLERCGVERHSRDASTLRAEWSRQCAVLWRRWLGSEARAEVQRKKDARLPRSLHPDHPADAQ